MKKIRYAVWRDGRTDTFEVVRWETDDATGRRTTTPVQTNILTWDKAAEALRTWKKREEDKHA